MEEDIIVLMVWEGEVDGFNKNLMKGEERKGKKKRRKKKKEVKREKFQKRKKKSGK